MGLGAAGEHGAARRGSMVDQIRQHPIDGTLGCGQVQDPGGVLRAGRGPRTSRSGCRHAGRAARSACRSGPRSARRCGRAGARPTRRRRGGAARSPATPRRSCAASASSPSKPGSRPGVSRPVTHLPAAWTGTAPTGISLRPTSRRRARAATICLIHVPGRSTIMKSAARAWSTWPPNVRQARTTSSVAESDQVTSWGPESNRPSSSAPGAPLRWSSATTRSLRQTPRIGRPSNCIRRTWERMKPITSPVVDGDQRRQLVVLPAVVERRGGEGILGEGEPAEVGSKQGHHRGKIRPLELSDLRHRGGIYLDCPP